MWNITTKQRAEAGFWKLDECSNVSTGILKHCYGHKGDDAHILAFFLYKAFTAEYIEGRNGPTKTVVLNNEITLSPTLPRHHSKFASGYTQLLLFNKWLKDIRKQKKKLKITETPFNQTNSQYHTQMVQEISDIWNKTWLRSSRKGEEGNSYFVANLTGHFLGLMATYWKNNVKLTTY